MIRRISALACGVALMAGAAIAQTPSKGDASRGAARAAACATCHGSSARAPVAGTPSLAGQQQVPRVANQREDYLAAAMKAYRDNQRPGADTTMNGVLYQVPDSDVQALAHYLAHYQPQ